MGLSGSLRASSFTYVTHSATPGVASLKNGFQFTLLTRGADIRRQPGVSISDAVNKLSNQASFTIDGSSNEPHVGEKVQITDSKDGDRLLFSGPVVSYETTFEDNTQALVHRTTAVGPAWLLNKYRPFGSYKNVGCSDVVKDLFAKYGPGFTTEFVQTNLAKVTAEFDGSLDFQSCMNQLADAIGGGHWYVDYDWKAHFFHTLANDATFLAALRAGPTAAPTVVESSGIPIAFTFDIGFYAFASTNVYDHGVESALSDWSPYIALQGTNQISFTNVAIGGAAGTHNVVKRRIYYKFIGPSGVPQSVIAIAQFCEIPDNTSTAFITYFKSKGSTLATVTDIDATISLPILRDVAPPAGPAVGPSVSQGSASLFYPQAPLVGQHTVVTFTRGPWAFRTVNIFADGTWSLPSPPSNTVDLDGASSAHLFNIPIGDPVNGVAVIARIVFASQGTRLTRTLSEVVADLEKSRAAGTLVKDYASVIGFSDAQVLQARTKVPGNYNELASIIGFSDLNFLLTGGSATDPDWSPDHTAMWFLITDNTSQVAEVGPGTGGSVLMPANSKLFGDVQWPNPDGPSLENFATPDDINDSNTQLLHDPPVSVTTDHTQTRNRIMVRGFGTSLTAASTVGSLSLQVADTSIFSKNGGYLIAGYQRRKYIGLSVPSGPGNITLQVALTESLETGASVNLWYQADDIDSQAAIGLIELDKNGKPTDGVHEYVINDASLRTPFMLFMRALAELEQYGRPIKSVRYATRDPKSRAGATVHIDLSFPPIFGDFLIQDVTIDQIHDEADVLLPRYSVTASSIRFDLNDLLLKIVDNGGMNNPPQAISSAGIVETSVLQTQAGATRSTLVITLSSAQAKILNSAPLKVIPSPGAGKFIHVTKFFCHSIQDSGTTYNASQAAVLKYGATADGVSPGTNEICRSSTMIAGIVAGQNRYNFANMGASTIEIFFDKAIDDLIGKPIILTSTGPATGGNAADTFTFFIEFEVLNELVPTSVFVA